MLIETTENQLLGRGFRCGFLGLFQKEIFCLRLEKEFKCRVICTFPFIPIRITYSDNDVQEINSLESISNKRIKKIEELMLEVKILTPNKYLGSILQLCHNYRGSFQAERLQDDFLLFELIYNLPFIEFIDNFNEKVKFFSQGYAFLDYEILGFQVSDIIKIDILLNDRIIPDLSFFVHKEQALKKARDFCQMLKESLPKHQFNIVIQACNGKKIISRANLPPLKKQVTGNLYGGDRTRKMKL